MNKLYWWCLTLFSCVIFCVLFLLFSYLVKEHISVTDSLLTKFHNITINVIQFNPYIRILFLNTVCTDVHKYNQCGLSTRISSWDFCNSLLYYALDCDVSPLQCDRIAMQFFVMQYNGYAILLRCKELHRIALFTMTLQKKIV